MKQRLKAWIPWLFVAALTLLWGLSFYLTDRACQLHSSFPFFLCRLSLPAVIVAPLLIAGTLGFVLGKRFGRRETTRSFEHDFD